MYWEIHWPLAITFFKVWNLQNWQTRVGDKPIKLTELHWAKWIRSSQKRNFYQEKFSMYESFLISICYTAILAPLILRYDAMLNDKMIFRVIKRQMIWTENFFWIIRLVSFMIQLFVVYSYFKQRWQTKSQILWNFKFQTQKWCKTDLKKVAHDIMSS